jgi:hypothetical protein
MMPVPREMEECLPEGQDAIAEKRWTATYDPSKDTGVSGTSAAEIFIGIVIDFGTLYGVHLRSLNDKY